MKNTIAVLALTALGLGVTLGCTAGESPPPAVTDGGVRAATAPATDPAHEPHPQPAPRQPRQPGAKQGGDTGATVSNRGPAGSKAVPQPQPPTAAGVAARPAARPNPRGAMAPPATFTPVLPAKSAVTAKPLLAVAAKSAASMPAGGVTLGGVAFHPRTGAMPALGGLTRTSPRSLAVINGSTWRRKP